MYVRFVIIAVMLTSANAFAAEPSKPAAEPAEQQQAHPADVVLASADDVHAPAPSDAQSSASPKRPRIARVTTCRCGDPQASEEQQQ